MGHKLDSHSVSDPGTASPFAPIGGAVLVSLRKIAADAYLQRMFKAFEFCLPTKATKVPAGPEWFHEIKQDGFRIRVERDGDRVRLITRGGYD